jgi:hypothetical protein
MQKFRANTVQLEEKEGLSIAPVSKKLSLSKSSGNNGMNYARNGKLAMLEKATSNNNQP